MVNVVALGAGAGHDRGVRDRRAVVTADGAGHAGTHRDDHQLRVGLLEAGDNDRDQDAEGAPGSPGCKGKTDCDQEDDAGQEGGKTGGVVLNYTGNELLGPQTRSCTVQCPGKGQDEDRRHHLLEPVGKTAHHLLKGQGFADQVIDHCNDQAAEGTQDQTDRSITVGKGVDESLSGKEAAGIDHTDDTADDQGKNRHEHVRDNSHFSLRIIDRIFIRAVGCRINIVLFLRIILMHSHGAVIDMHQDEHDHHCNREQGIVVVRNSADKQRKAVFSLDKPGYCRRPAGNRRNDTDGCRGGIDQIGQLGA